MKIKWLGFFYLFLGGTLARPDGEGLRSSKSFSLFSVVQFPNDECVVASDNTMNGICRSADECGGSNGIASGNCASGFGVCCYNRIEGAAGSTSDITQNGTYIQNPAFPTAVTTAGVFTYRVMPSNSAGICQLRIDFEDVELTQPVQGACAAVDRITITGGAQPNPPVVCGHLDGQHIYVSTGKQSTAATIVLTKVGVANSHWKIRTREIECSSEVLPPDGCTQYYTGTSGVIKSFNADAPAPMTILADSYKICMRQEDGRCTMNLSETRPEAAPNSFFLDAAGAMATNVCAAAGTCLIIDGAQYGGQVFSAVNNDIISGVVTANAPFEVDVFSVGTQVGNSLFDLTYRQIPC